jgi:hypothetical protein
MKTTNGKRYSNSQNVGKNKYQKNSHRTIIKQDKKDYKATECRERKGINTNKDTGSLLKINKRERDKNTKEENRDRKG